MLDKRRICYTKFELVINKIILEKSVVKVFAGTVQQTLLPEYLIPKKSTGA